MKTLNKSQRVNGEKQAFVYTTAFVMGFYTWTKFRDIWPSPSVSRFLKVSAVRETKKIIWLRTVRRILASVKLCSHALYVCVCLFFTAKQDQVAQAVRLSLVNQWTTAIVSLTEHCLQSDQTGDKVVKVDSHVCLCVSQDDQLEQVVSQLETWRKQKQENPYNNVKKCQRRCSTDNSEKMLSAYTAGT